MRGELGEGGVQVEEEEAGAGGGGEEGFMRRGGGFEVGRWRRPREGEGGGVAALRASSDGTRMSVY